MNRHRDDLALVMDSADFRRDSHVRARPPGLAEGLQNVIVRPTIVLDDRRYERRVEAAASALAVQAAKLHALLAEPLTRPLGSMQTPHCFTGEDGITLIQSKHEPVRYDSARDTYHGLREIRENAHARLASLEAAAVGGRGSRAELTDHDAQARTAPARPDAGGHRTSHVRPRSVGEYAQEATVTPRPSRMGGPPRRSEGLTDARNALRSAYAASKLRAPNAPPRSSAKKAGVVDGWERLPEKKTKRSRSHGTRPRAVWPWAAGLAASSMLFAYALTLTVVPQSELVSQPQAIAAAIVPPQPELSAPPAPVAAIAAQPPLHAKTPKPPARASARVECREHTPRTN